MRLIGLKIFTFPSVFRPFLIVLAKNIPYNWTGHTKNNSERVLQPFSPLYTPHTHTYKNRQKHLQSKSKQ